MGRKSRYTEYAKGMNKARTRISLRRKRIRRPEQKKPKEVDSKKLGEAI